MSVTSSVNTGKGAFLRVAAMRGADRQGRQQSRGTCFHRHLQAAAGGANIDCTAGGCWQQHASAYIQHQQQQEAAGTHPGLLRTPPAPTASGVVPSSSIQHMSCQAGHASMRLRGWDGSAGRMPAACMGTG
jgi:hypothetical protein